VRIPIHGRRLALRASDSIDLDDLGLDLDLAGDLQRGLGISGEVLVASGRYVEDFTVRDMVISPTSTSRRWPHFTKASRCWRTWR
jgi:hypothetical protein